MSKRLPVPQSIGVDCAGCPSNCCPRGDASSPTYVLLLPDEVRAFEDSGAEVLSFTASDGVTVVHYTTYCPHLGEDNRCGVYETRPLDCRTFPFIPHYVGTEERVTVAMMTSSRCPQGDRASTGYGLMLADQWRSKYPGRGWVLAVRELDKSRGIS